MRKIAFITPPDVEYGFSLTGITQVVSEAIGTEDALKKIMEDMENGLVIIDERLVNAGRDSTGLSEERLRELEHRWQGILLVLPSPDKPPAEAEDYAARLIRRAIGYHVRLKL
ncbi:MAG: ATPase [Nitrospirae bacterium GWD2_57_9]|nr:MAG: ATPase [Nitrospirae bacterium GWD2_57_9]OGW50713.1 MAG: ATPase [Nitrospirae bacterium GWC2_57_9]